MPKALPEDIRERIVESAERHVWRNGFAATRISEIAADVGIGKGSVYLFFDTKDDLGLAVAARYKEKILADQREIARRDDLPPAEKVRRILKVPILTAHECSRQYPHARQMILDIYAHIPEKWNALRVEGLAVLREVLAAGRRSGSFCFADAAQTAETLKNMTGGFLPPFWWTGETAALETQVDAVIDLGLRGLITSRE